MTSRSKIKAKIERLRSELKVAENELLALDRSCNHVWGEPIRDDFYEPGYTIPGDPIGIMGIDRRFPIYVESKTTPRWKRVCSECGKVEFTNKIKTVSTYHPEF
jgi:hypothetical protein